MKIRSFLTAAKIGFMILLAQGLAAEAAEVKVITGVGMSAVLGELGPQFERATSHKLLVWYGNRGTIRLRIEAGEAFDLAIIGSLDEFIKEGKITQVRALKSPVSAWV
jgi:molybdate transport system substrate-binding protein